MSPAELMQQAIEAAGRGIAAGQTPFGCAIAVDGKIVATQHNTVLATTDITAHAEINALRAACRQQGDIHLERAVVATTCEPCPMCMAALHWARVATVYYGATIGDAAQAGFNELKFPAAELVNQGGGQVQLVPGVLVEECRALFDQWRARDDAQTY